MRTLTLRSTEGDLYSGPTQGSAINSSADVLTLFVLGQNLYPSDTYIAAVLANARALGKKYNVVPFYEMGDTTELEEWEPNQ